MNITREKPSRYIVIHEGSNRIVATCGGTHAMMTNVCQRLDNRNPGSAFFYDDASEASNYLPQIGPNIALSVRAW